jgi:hypothetical protein
MPDYDMKGEEDNPKWENMLQFFILDKTDYSEHDRDAFLNIFVKRKSNPSFVDKLLEDKTNSEGVFCVFILVKGRFN